MTRTSSFRRLFPCLAGIAVGALLLPGSALGQDGALGGSTVKPAEEADEPPTAPTPDGAIKSTTPPPATAPTTAPAQDLPPPSVIVERAIELMGGRKAFESVKSVRYRMEALSSGGDTTYEIWHADWDQIRVDGLNSRGPRTMSRTREGAWQRHPDIGLRLMNVALTSQVFNTDLYGIVLNLVDPRFELETMGRGTLGGRTCYKVQITNPDGLEAWGYFDLETGLLNALDQAHYVNQDDPPMMSRVFLTDYGLVGPLQVFTKGRVELGPDVTTDLVFSNVKFNTVSAADLAAPAEVVELLAAAEKNVTTRPDPEAEEAEAYRQIVETIKSMDDAGQLLLIRAALQAQMGQVPADDRANVQAVIDLIDERTTALQSGGG